MRALVISPTASHPLVQGNRIRIRQIAQGMKDMGMRVDFLCYDLDGADADARREMSEAWDGVFLVGTDGFSFHKTQGDMWGIDDWVAPSALQMARQLAQTRRYDFVIINYVWMSALFEPFVGTGARLILDTHDAFGDRDITIAESGMAPHWYYTSVAEERRGLDRADLVLAIQNEEGALLAARTQRPVKVIEYAAEPAMIPLPQDGLIRLGYIGSNNPWNVLSITAFDRALANSSSFRKVRNHFDCRIYGGVCSELGPTLIFSQEGRVREIEDAYENLDILVNPMVGGTGLKIKTVESLAFGRPILSTKAGGVGLEGIHSDLHHRDVPSIVKRLSKLSTRHEVCSLRDEMVGGYAAYCSQVTDRMRLVLTSPWGSQYDVRGSHR